MGAWDLVTDMRPLGDSQKQLPLKGERRFPFTSTTLLSQLPHTQYPFLLLCLAITQSCSSDHMGSPPFTGWHLELLQDPFPHYSWRDHLPLGFGGTLLSTCTPAAVFKICRNLIQFGMGYIHNCPFHGSLETQLTYSFLQTMASYGCQRREKAHVRWYLRAGTSCFTLERL